LRFVKYHGLGNDFIIIDRFEGGDAGFDRSLVVPLCRRGFGVGADGVILAEPPASSGDARMIIYNADGSEAEMCGNGIRCLGDFLAREGHVPANPMWIETASGARLVKVLEADPGERVVEVDMGLPEFHRPSIPMTGSGSDAVRERLVVGEEIIEATCLSMGNPHCVIFVENISEAPLEKMGPAIEKHDAFPRKTNVEMVEVAGEQHLLVRVWERGVGITQACGTGACAAFAAALAEGRASSPMRVDLPGGSLHIALGEGGHIFMRGPVAEVYRAEVSGDWLSLHGRGDASR
jgi:diaminopimelate epimerase